jgi:hypothetical protein
MYVNIKRFQISHTKALKFNLERNSEPIANIFGFLYNRHQKHFKIQQSSNLCLQNQKKMQPQQEPNQPTEESDSILEFEDLTRFELNMRELQCELRKTQMKMERVLLLMKCLKRMKKQSHHPRVIFNDLIDLYVNSYHIDDMEERRLDFSLVFEELYRKTNICKAFLQAYFYMTGNCGHVYNYCEGQSILDCLSNLVWVDSPLENPYEIKLDFE